MPAPRADTPLTPEQIKQVTNDLISQREHLSSEAQANGQPNPAPTAAGNATPPAGAAQNGPQTPSAYAKP